MNSKYLFGTAALLLGAAGLEAQYNTASLVINAKSDPKNAPSIVAMAALENPKYTLLIVNAAVRAMPARTVEIVRAVLRVDPKDAAEIVRQAILAQPSQAVEITTAAVALLPDQSAAIVKAAVAVAPVDLRSAIAAPSDTGGGIGNENVSGGSPVSPSFPSQPVDAGLISPAT
jgi:hypothetical protein